MDNKLIKNLKTEQETAVDDIAYLQELGSTLSEWNSENDTEDYQSL